jgi:hypothetical protein
MLVSRISSLVLSIIVQVPERVIEHDDTLPERVIEHDTSSKE